MRQDMVQLSDHSEDEAGPSSSRQPASGRVVPAAKRSKTAQAAPRAVGGRGQAGAPDEDSWSGPGSEEEPGSEEQDGQNDDEEQRRASNAAAGPGPSSGGFADGRCPSNATRARAAQCGAAAFQCTHVCIRSTLQ